MLADSAVVRVLVRVRILGVNHIVESIKLQGANERKWNTWGISADCDFACTPNRGEGISNHSMK